MKKIASIKHYDKLIPVYAGDKFWEHSGFWEVVSYNPETKMFSCKCLVLKDKPENSQAKAGFVVELPASYVMAWVPHQCRSPKTMYAIVVVPSKTYCSPIMIADRENRPNKTVWVAKDGHLVWEFDSTYVGMDDKEVIRFLTADKAEAAAFMAGLQSGLYLARTTILEHRPLAPQVRWSKDYWVSQAVERERADSFAGQEE